MRCCYPLSFLTVSVDVYPANVLPPWFRLTYLIRHDLHANFIQGKVIGLGHLLSGSKKSEVTQAARDSPRPTAACSLTCSWAAFLWSLGHMRGSISTGRCATLSSGTSETTGQGRTHLDRPRRQSQVGSTTHARDDPRSNWHTQDSRHVRSRGITDVILTGNHMPDLGFMSVTQSLDGSRVRPLICWLWDVRSDPAHKTNIKEKIDR